MKQIVLALATVVTLFSCSNNNSSDTAAAVEKAKKETIDSINAINVAKQQVIDSMNAVKHSAHKGKTMEAATPNSYAAPSTAAADNTPAPAPARVAKKKKGWSHTAKGAVVGAGAGAITGAIINPDHVKGAAIGTIIGAGVGAGTGAIVDHAKKKKAANQ
ncbi:hypothetical protein [Chitinophaga sp. HK235]|uniref:hypothetical protein n=1 Tax=Chitinophaga sp. HK235 TaxID=2952571 RepID=UPI001BA821B7|nr:hypothetical protein [Chitinophaga sp. HK235]